MKAEQALDNLKPEQCAATSINVRIRLLKEVRTNLKNYGEELGRADAAMKNNQMGELIYNVAESKVATVVPIASTLSAAIDLYASLAKGKKIEPINVEQIGKNTFKIQVFPQSAKEK